MGINFSHGNARWGYGGFHRFRGRIVNSLGIERPLKEIYDDNEAPEWEILKQSPMYRFIDHSDCDGFLTPEELEVIIPEMERIISGWEDCYDKEMGLELLEGKRCRMLARGAMNSCLLEFEDGTKVVTSRNAIRRAK